MPQIREVNAYRSYLALATRKDTRQYLVPKDLFSGDDLTKLTEGTEGAVIVVDTDKYQGSLENAVVPVRNAPIASSIPQWLAIVERDLEQAIGQSPNVMGLITKATAQEVATAQQYTESDFGRHAERRDDWLARVLTVALRAITAALHDRGDSAGAYDRDESVALAVDDARPAEAANRDGHVFQKYDRARALLRPRPPQDDPAERANHLTWAKIISVRPVPVLDRECAAQPIRHIAE